MEPSPEVGRSLSDREPTGALPAVESCLSVLRSTNRSSPSLSPTSKPTSPLLTSNNSLSDIRPLEGSKDLPVPPEKDCHISLDVQKEQGKISTPFEVADREVSVSESPIFDGLSIFSKLKQLPGSYKESPTCEPQKTPPTNPNRRRRRGDSLSNQLKSSSAHAAMPHLTPPPSKLELESHLPPLESLPASAAKLPPESSPDSPADEDDFRESKPRARSIKRKVRRKLSPSSERESCACHSGGCNVCNGMASMRSQSGSDSSPDRRSPDSDDKKQGMCCSPLNPKLLDPLTMSPATMVAAGLVFFKPMLELHLDGRAPAYLQVPPLVSDSPDLPDPQVLSDSSGSNGGELEGSGGSGNGSGSSISGGSSVVPSGLEHNDPSSADQQPAPSPIPLYPDLGGYTFPFSSSSSSFSMYTSPAFSSSFVSTPYQFSTSSYTASSYSSSSSDTSASYSYPYSFSSYTSGSYAASSYSTCSSYSSSFASAFYSSAYPSYSQQSYSYFTSPAYTTDAYPTYDQSQSLPDPSITSYPPPTDLSSYPVSSTPLPPPPEGSEYPSISPAVLAQSLTVETVVSPPIPQS